MSILKSSKYGSANSLLRKFKSALITSTLLLSLAAAGMPANAASQCKSLANNACAANAECTWVQGYERKDGRTVKSFCRAKAKPKTPKKTTSRS
ncbi:MAG: hypothetical protein KJP04_06240 [Arenicella sp.]|nr:hypothetical protein [Arenicella sp.]